VVFSTKDRYPAITNDWRDALHAYLGRIVKSLGGLPLAIGGIEDHAHILIGLRTTHRLDYVMRDVKSGSSEWVHGTVGKRTFGWQPGYFGITVSPSHVERVKRYIFNQAEHHRHKSFKDEYIEMLKLAGVEYDERYVW
jgi:REP element-mobilizing transposase RayT